MAAEVATTTGALLPPDALRHPAFDPLRPWLARLSQSPALPELNALAGSCEPLPVTASGKPVRFFAPDALDAASYEQRIFDTGLIATRPDNRHDLFNALVWLAFPRTKAAINARHVARMSVEGSARGPLRDLLTLLDEGGVIVAGEASSIQAFESLIRSFRWREVFWERRAALLGDTRFVLFGHNAYEKSLAPYPGITCKALFLPTPAEILSAPAASLVAWLDQAAAAWVAALPDDARPRGMAPLPVFGRPGWLPQADGAGFYEDRRWFRAAPERRPAG